MEGINEYIQTKAIQIRYEGTTFTLSSTEKTLLTLHSHCSIHE